MWFIIAHRYTCHEAGAHAVPLICDKSLDVGRKAGGPLSAHVAGDKSISKFQFELVVAHNDPTDLSLQLDVVPTTPALSVIDHSGKATTLLEDNKPIRTPDTPIRIQHVRSCIRAGKRGATFTLVWVPIVLVVDSAALSKEHLDQIHSGAHMLGLKLAMDRWDAQATHVVCRPDVQLTPVQALAIQLGSIPVDPSWILSIAQNVMPVEMNEPDDITTALHSTFFRVQPSRQVDPDSLMTKPINNQTIVLDSSLTSTLSDSHRTALDAILTHLGAKSIADASQPPPGPFLTLSATDQPTRDLGHPVCSLDTLLSAVVSGSDIAACFTRLAADPPSQLHQPSSGSSLTSSLGKAPPLSGFTASLLRSQGGSSIPRSSPFGLTQGGLLSGLTSRTGASSGGITQGGLLSGNSAKSGGQSMLFGGSIGAGTSFSALMANKDRSQPLASSLFSSGTPGSSATQFTKPNGGKLQAQVPAATQQKLAPSLLDQIGKTGSLSEVGFHVPKRPAPPPAQTAPDSPLSDLQDTPPAGRLSPLTTTADDQDKGSQGGESDQSQLNRDLEKQPEQGPDGEQGEASGLGQGDEGQEGPQADKDGADPAPEPEPEGPVADGTGGGMTSISVVRLIKSTAAASANRGRPRPTHASASNDPKNVKPFRKRWPLSPPDSLDDPAPRPPRPRITIRVVDPRNAGTNADASQQQDSMDSSSPKRHTPFTTSTISTPPRPHRTRFMTLDDDSNSDDDDDDDSAGAYVVPPCPRSPPMSVRGSAPPSPQVARGKRRRRLMDSDDDEQDELLEMTVAEERRAAAVADTGSFGQERTVRKRRKLLDSP